MAKDIAWIQWYLVVAVTCWSQQSGAYTVQSGTTYQGGPLLLLHTGQRWYSPHHKPRYSNVRPPGRGSPGIIVMSAIFSPNRAGSSQPTKQQENPPPRNDTTTTTTKAAALDNGGRLERDVNSTSLSTQSGISAPPPAGSKLRQLKDLMWVRETLEDLTAAEFACTVEAAIEEEEQLKQQLQSRGVAGNETAPATVMAQINQRRRKRAVDYEKLIRQLNKRIHDMGCGDCSHNLDGNDDSAPLTCVFLPGVGMGSFVYTIEQRSALFERIIRTRHHLLAVIKGYTLESPVEETDMPFSIALPEIRVEFPKYDDGSSIGPKLYVRDDGTVDWDGALQDQAALRKFGRAVWARINGREPDSIDNITGEKGEGSAVENKIKEVTAKIEETDEIRQARERLIATSNELARMEAAHTALLNSVIQAGQAVANVRLASLAPDQRNKIRGSAEAIELMKENVLLSTLVYELERIYTYLLKEIGTPALNGYIPLQDRLNVAEFGLLESQICNFNRQIDAGEVVDGDLLKVVMEQMTDFKRRLGIDYYVTGLTFDSEAIRRWLYDLLDKTKKGLAFYVKGVQLFWNDIVFCLKLIGRATQGYTLKPREVRTIRRTFKDIITSIPVVIILLIPLSPVGHVLVFGAIQRFFPDFFPSCFTEQRQNLLQLYETAEYSEVTVNESLSEKLARVSEAFAYFIANLFRSLYLRALLLVQGSRTGEKPDQGQ